MNFHCILTSLLIWLYVYEPSTSMALLWRGVSVIYSLIFSQNKGANCKVYAPEKKEKTFNNTRQQHSFLSLLIYLFSSTNQDNDYRLLTVHNSSDSDDDLRSRCRNVHQCHNKQSFSGLHSPRQSYFPDLKFLFLF